MSCSGSEDEDSDRDENRSCSGSDARSLTGDNRADESSGDDSIIVKMDKLLYESRGAQTKD
jgi:hypothetical protein